MQTSARIQVVALAPGQARAAAGVLESSHADYPSFRELIADPARRRGVLRATFTATARDALRSGVVHAASDGDRLLGVAVWLPPGGFPWSPRRKLRAVPLFLSVLGRAPAAFGRFAAMGRNAERAFPSTPHWYLEVLGVRPEAQGQGLGTRLLEPVLSRADRDGVSCYLETADPANVAFYERLGFRLEGRVQLLPGGPPHWALRRPPRSSDRRGGPAVSGGGSGSPRRGAGRSRPAGGGPPRP
jgi:GNAT superfamily N-acetyltransferase